MSEIGEAEWGIRPMIENDLEAVVALSLQAWAPVFQSFEGVLGQRIFQRVYPDWLTSQSAAVAEACRGPHVWVAELSGRQALGFVAVALRPETGSAEVDMLAVDPGYQGRGVATALLSTALDFARQAGVQLVEVGTGGDEGHLAARRTYEKAGFVALPLVRYYKAL